MDTKGQHFKLKNYLDYLNPRENISIILKMSGRSC